MMNSTNQSNPQNHSNFSKNKAKTLAVLAEVSRSINSGPLGPRTCNQKMKFQFNIEISTFLKIEKFLKIGSMDPNIKLEISSPNSNLEGTNKQMLKINLIL